MRSSIVTIIILVAPALVVAGTLPLLFPLTTDQIAPESDENPEVITLKGSDSGFWPYSSASHDFTKVSPINVVIRGNTTQIMEIMQNQTDAEWTVPPPDQKIGWGESGWSDRYAYVHDGTEGEWIDMTTELHDGDYYGARYHARLYESPSPTEEWVVMQVHTEYFNWFTLQHTVVGTERGQRHVETDFADHSSVEKIRYVYLGNADSSDSNGRATVVELAFILPVLLIGMTSVRHWYRRFTSLVRHQLYVLRRRLTWRHALLMGTLIGLLFGVRVTGIMLERHGGFRSMTTIAALLFPVISIGIPAAAYGIAHQIEHSADAALTASLALLIAILLDHTYVGVDILPIEIIVHWGGIIIAIGLIAGGATHRATRRSRFNKILVSGVLLWGGLLLVGVVHLA